MACPLPSARGDDGQQTVRGCTSQPTVPGQTRPAEWSKAWEAFKKDLQQATGTSIGLCAITTNQVVLNGQGESKDRTVFWWNLNVTQRLWQGAQLIGNARGGSGHGLDGIVLGKHGTNWMSNEPECVYVSHLLLEQKCFDDRLTFWLGKLDLGDYFDTNEVAGWDFLSYSLARNPTIPFPWHALGAAARFEPAPWFYVEGGLADAQGKCTETGFTTAFHGEDYFFSICEFGLRPNLGGRRGNYRFILWYDPQPIRRIDGCGCKRDDVGFALNVDQQVTDRLTAFFRYGFAHQQVREVEHFWSTGVAWSGPIPGRPRDVLTLGAGQSIMGEDYRRANRSAPADTIFELFYKVRLTEWCWLSPDVEVVLSPGADRERDVNVIAGLRLGFGF